MSRTGLCQSVTSPVHSDAYLKGSRKLFDEKRYTRLLPERFLKHVHMIYCCFRARQSLCKLRDTVHHHCRLCRWTTLTQSKTSCSLRLCYKLLVRHVEIHLLSTLHSINVCKLSTPKQPTFTERCNYLEKLFRQKSTLKFPPDVCWKSKLVAFTTFVQHKIFNVEGEYFVANKTKTTTTKNASLDKFPKSLWNYLPILLSRDMGEFFIFGHLNFS